MYKLLVYKNTRKIDAIISAENLWELAEKFYTYRCTHLSGGYFINLYEGLCIATQGTFDEWQNVYRKYIKQVIRMKELEDDFV